MFFQPRTIYETETFLSGKIRVVQERDGKRKLMVGGLVQSVYDPKNAMTRGVWDEFLRMAKTKHETVDNVLILGLGAGTSAKQFLSVFPNCRVFGVEIEPKIIEVGKIFFDMSHEHLREIIADAADWIKSEEAKTRKYDVICVDTYVGDKVPPHCESEEFLKDLVLLLTSKGVVIFNRLYYKNKKDEADKFIDKIKKIFHDVSIKEIHGGIATKNILILASRPTTG